MYPIEPSRFTPIPSSSDTSSQPAARRPVSNADNEVKAAEIRHPAAKRHRGRSLLESQLRKAGLSPAQIAAIGDKPDAISRLTATATWRQPILDQGFSIEQIVEIACSPAGALALAAAAKHSPAARKRGLSSTAVMTQIVSGANGPAALAATAARFRKHEISDETLPTNEDEKALIEALACFRNFYDPVARIDQWFTQRWDPDNDGSDEISHLLPRMESFEVGLARQLFHDPAARRAMDAAIVRLRDVLLALNPAVPRKIIESAFFNNNVWYANVGAGVMTLDELREKGNVRMLAVAFLNAAYRWRNEVDFGKSLSRLMFDPTEWDWRMRAEDAGLNVERLGIARERLLASGERDPVGGPRVYFHPESHGAVAELCAMREARQIRPPEERARLRWTPVDYERNGVPLASAERAHLERHGKPVIVATGDGRTRELYPMTWAPLAANAEGPDYPVSVSAGGELSRIRLDTRWAAEVVQRRQQLVISGISGSTAGVLAVFKWLNVSDISNVSEAHFLRALYAWMRLPDGHSLYEILRGAQITDPHLFRGERLELFGDGPNSLGASRELWDEVAAQADTSPAAARVIAEGRRPE